MSTQFLRNPKVARIDLFDALEKQEESLVRLLILHSGKDRGTQLGRPKCGSVITLCFLFLLIGTSFARAAEIKIVDNFNVLEGEIVQGDYEKVLRFLASDNRRRLTFNWQLNSPGGDVVEAIRIGKLFRDLLIHVNVGSRMNPNAKCASACFFVFVGAVSRTAFDHSLGLHRPFFDARLFANLTAQSARQKYTDMSLDLRSFLFDQGVPDLIISRMFSMPSNEVYWLTPEEYESVGDKTPWYDQYVFASCGFTARMFIIQVERGSRARAKDWAECEAHLTYDTSHEQLTNLLRSQSQTR